MSTSGGPVAVGGSAPLAGNLAAPYTVTAALATFLTTAVLAVGTWLVTMGANCAVSAGQGEVEIEVAAGTATATFAGKTGGGTFTSAGVNETNDVVLTFIATVTVAGTLVFQAIDAAAPGTSGVINATTGSSGLAKATGYTATRVA